MLATPPAPSPKDLARARALQAGGRIAEAEAVYRAIIAANPGDADALHLAGVAAHQLGRSQDGATLIARALAVNPGMGTAWQNYILPLITLGRHEDAVKAGENAVRLMPKKSAARGNLVLALVRSKRLDEAALVAEAGLAIDPLAAGLWTQLAHIRMEQSRPDIAEALLRRALEIDPEHLEARYNLGCALQVMRQDAEAADCFERVIAKDPAHRGGRLNLGVAYRSLGRIKDALAVWGASQTPAAEWPDLAYNFGCAYLLAGDWGKAWDGWEQRTDTIQPVEINYMGGRPRWRGEMRRDATLVVYHEQGLGDTIQSCRFLDMALARVGKVIFVCQRPLLKLVSSLPAIASGKVELIGEGDALPEHDLHVPLMSLPALFDVRRDTMGTRVPYLSGGQDRRKAWAQQLDAALPRTASGRPAMRVGLVWQGNPLAPVEKGRSIPFDALAGLAGLDDIAFVSLQKGHGADAPPPAGLVLHRLGSDFDAKGGAFIDTVAVSSALDLTITSDTSMAHVLGALGRPVWLLLKFVPDWRWGVTGQLTPWYPSMRIFRQTAADDWAGVVAEVRRELGVLLDVRRGVLLPEGTDYEVAVGAAVRRHEAGDFAGAVAGYRALSASRPNDPRVLNLYGMALWEQGGRSEAARRHALPLVLRSVGIAPAISDFWSNLALLFEKGGQRGDARQAIGHALAASPGHAPSHLALANIEASEGDVDGALKRARRVIAAAPKQTSGYTTYATIATGAERHAEAVGALRLAAEIEPDAPKIQVQYGAALMAHGEPDAAARAWEKALIANPLNADALGNLGVYERSHGEIGLAEWFHREASIADPRHAEAWSNLGIAAMDGGRMERAEAAFRRAIELKPSYADAHMALGMALLGRGRWDEGLVEYEWRLKSTRLGMEKDLPRRPFWRGEDPRGKTFLALAEQGFGDAIQFVRFARHLKAAGAAKVYVGCRKRLAALLSTVDAVDGVVAEGGAVPPVDYVTHLMSLPLRFKVQVDTIPGGTPYLKADPDRVERWAEVLAAKPGFRVGLIWQGNPDPQVDKGRSLPLALLEPLAKIPGVRLIALQKGAGSEQVEQVADRFEVEVLGPDFDEGPDSFLDTAAVAMNLDLVVTTDTAVAHLIGGLDRPVWLLAKAQAEWRWLETGGGSAWYPSMRLFRQYAHETDGDPWPPAIGRLAGELAKLVEGDRVRLTDRSEVGARPPVPKPLTLNQRFNAGLDAHQAGRRAEARAHYASVLVDNPDHTEALHMLGAMALQDMNWPRAAIFLTAASRRGLSTPDFRTNLAVALRNLGRQTEAEALVRGVLKEMPTSEGWLTLGNLLRDRDDPAGALAAMQAAVKLGPKSPKAYRGLANAQKDAGDMKASLASFATAVKLAPDDAEMRLDRAHALMYAGDFTEGFAEYEWRWKGVEIMPRAFDVPRWMGEPIKGKTLLVHGEQGLGDNIQFCRFVAACAERAGHVVLEVRRPLFGMMRALGLPEDKVTLVEQGGPLPPHDLQVPMMSLPHVLKVKPAMLGKGVPYLTADPVRVATWREKLAGGPFSVGLVWQGNPKARADKGRSPPLAGLKPLFDLPGIRFVSLQKEHGLDQISADLAARIERPEPGFDAGADAFLDTAAAMTALDLIVTSDTAAAHLAGALGRPTLTMIKAVPDWRWTTGREDSVWYPTMKVIRQTEPGDWAGVAARVAAEVKARSATGKAKRR